MINKGASRFKELFLYSDSEPNEALIGLCHAFVLPAAIMVDFESDSTLLCLFGVLVGVFQLWAVLFNGTLKYRLIGVQLASLVAIMTVENLIASGLFNGSRMGWGIILVFAIWNTVRVYMEKTASND